MTLCRPPYHHCTMVVFPPQCLCHFLLGYYISQADPTGCLGSLDSDSLITEAPSSGFQEPEDKTLALVVLVRLEGIVSLISASLCAETEPEDFPVRPT